MKLIIGIALLLASAAPLVQAHEGHVHESALEAPPHGGLLRDAGSYKSEAVIEGDVVKVYVYDKDLKPLKLDAETVKGDFQFPKKKTRPLTFKRNGDFYQAKIPGLSKVHRFDMHVYFVINGEKATADFGIDNVH